jgi:hypothetical protein
MNFLNQNQTEKPILERYPFTVQELELLCENGVLARVSRCADSVMDMSHASQAKSTLLESRGGRCEY